MTSKCNPVVIDRQTTRCETCGSKWNHRTTNITGCMAVEDPNSSGGYADSGQPWPEVYQWGEWKDFGTGNEWYDHPYHRKEYGGRYSAEDVARMHAEDDARAIKNGSVPVRVQRTDSTELVPQPEHEAPRSFMSRLFWGD